MSTLAHTRPAAGALRRVSTRAWSTLLAAWGALTGIAPHVLHHVGPLAGAAMLAGTGGRLIFAAIALLVSVPFLLRIHRRFRTRLAPTLTLLAMAAMFSLSTFVIGPLITGGDRGGSPPGIQQPGGHMGHRH